MAYPHYQITVPLLSCGTSSLTLNTTTGLPGRWDAGPMQYIVRRVAVQVTTTVVTAAAVISFRKVCGSTFSGATGGQFAKITLTATGQREDHLYFNDGFTPTKIPAGYSIVARVTTGSSGERMKAWAMVEPSPERLQNFSTGNFISVTA